MGRENESLSVHFGAQACIINDLGDSFVASPASHISQHVGLHLR